MKGSTPITVLTGKDNPAALLPVRFGEDVIVGLPLLKLPKLLADALGDVGQARRRSKGKNDGKLGKGAICIVGIAPFRPTTYGSNGFSEAKSGCGKCSMILLCVRKLQPC
jgi:hypothetical protein